MTPFGGCIRVIGVLSMLTMASPALAERITLAANVHAASETDGNNHYSDDGPEGTNGIGAENFTLSGRFDITGISHVGHHSRTLSQPDSIDWWIYGDSAGLPGAVLYSGTSAFRTNIEGEWAIYDLTRYSIDLSGVTLGAGHYWVGFHNNSGARGDPHWTFATSGSSFDGRSALFLPGSGRWETPYPGGNMTFAVEGTPAPVPEPSTWLLLGSGLAVLTRRWRGRRPAVPHPTLRR